MAKLKLITPNNRSTWYMAGIMLFGILAVGQLYYSNQEADKLYVMANKKLDMIHTKNEAISDMLLRIQNRSITLLRMVNESDEFEIDELYQRLFFEAARFRESRDRLQQTNLTGWQRNTVKRLLTLTGVNAEIQMSIGDALMNGEGNTETSRLLFDVVIPNQTPMYEMVRDIIISIEDEQNSTLKELRELQQENTTINFILSLVLSVSAIIFLFLLAQRLKANLNLFSTHETVSSAIINSALDAIVVADDFGNISLFNKGAVDLFGYTELEVYKRPISDFLDVEFKDLLSCDLNAHDEHTIHDIYHAKHKNGRLIPIQLTLSDTQVSGDNRFSIILRDMTEIIENQRLLLDKTKALKKARENFRRLSETDSLTQVANRLAYNNQLVEDINNAKRSDDALAMLVIDIDFYKAYNDFYGHEHGDNTLKAIANSIKAALPRATDFVARYGGEEFVVLLPTTNEKGAIHVAQRIRQNVIANNIPHAKSTVSDVVTVSIGVSVLSGKALTAQELFSQADHALFKSKNDGRNRVTLFQED